jgi:hypothetical protein
VARINGAVTWRLSLDVFGIILARVRSVGRPVSGCVARLGEGRFHIWAELFLGAEGEKPMGEMWVSVAA